MTRDGNDDLADAADALALRLPAELAPLARLAFNYWWSWSPGGADLFASLDPDRWSRCGHNPVRLLQEITPLRSRDFAADAGLMARVHDLARAMDVELARPPAVQLDPTGRPLVYMCAEFGIHHSLPLYGGGLGVLAGDFLKEASDRALPVAGVGLLYWQGSFHQRLDTSGWQHEYWLDTDAERLPAARVTDDSGRPLTIAVPVRGRELAVQIWRVNVGRVPLFLLDSNLPENSAVDRWITARLYIGDKEIRLAQYALLGLGGVRALRALGIDPAVIHLNEGHAALASFELVAEEVGKGQSFEAALAAARARTVFTTHTPVAAGNDTFTTAELREALDGLPSWVGLDWGRFLGLGRCLPDDALECFGMTPLALRASRAANGVSRRHGQVARSMWRTMWPHASVDDVPIGHVTNGVHLPTWMAPPMRELLDRYLGVGWRDAVTDPATWAAIDAIPDEELWAVRCRLREELAAYVRDRSVWDRLGRGHSIEYAQLAARLWDAGTLTIGFARRITTYKRLYLLSTNPERGVRLLNGVRPVQLLIAGRAHPQDVEAKRSVQQIFPLADLPNVGGRVAFLEDHDLGMAARLVQGCDLWVNLPRPPLEASGTSGMKSMLNGGLQLSVLDGWWAEAYDGTNGWAIPAHEGLDPAAQDARDVNTLFDLLESEAIPLFYERDAGIPHGWVQRIKASFRTLGPRFTATRMLDDYLSRIWAPA